MFVRKVLQKLIVIKLIEKTGQIKVAQLVHAHRDRALACRGLQSPGGFSILKGKCI